jgi:protein-L-isoaspartate(D-aspartate) O-methyltransferase
MAEFAAQRLNMIESQLRTNKVTDPAVLRAMGELPRERFLPPAMRPIAYVDDDLALGGGRFLMEPMVMARLVQAVVPHAAGRALEVGGGCGYGAAILARLALEVVALEADEAAADAVRSALGANGCRNVTVAVGPLAEGWSNAAPYDAILVGGAVPSLPQALLDQLGPNGRLAAVVAGAGGLGRATLAERRGGTVSQRILFDAATRPLAGLVAAPGFVF